MERIRVRRYLWGKEKGERAQKRLSFFRYKWEGLLLLTLLLPIGSSLLRGEDTLVGMRRVLVANKPQPYQLVLTQKAATPSPFEQTRDLTSLGTLTGFLTLGLLLVGSISLSFYNLKWEAQAEQIRSIDSTGLAKWANDNSRLGDLTKIYEFIFKHIEWNTSEDSHEENKKIWDQIRSRNGKHKGSKITIG